ncbi:NAD(P)/FAD-dependent oxidoreductase [Tetragenococcus halophilus]|uniref:NAD(P)/FAD-dependent oxidoreductase n=1 Tax=Tetragenococcus halophilus TaxID=51669 RepID=UPI00256A0F74|nr:NAD(P)/FAD-dependent oxidoreductase [Tetragenococcus halophilus]GMG69584.1 NAD(P)/FAD-dependent oxidoreductase [Tetragenococcus halophilus]
MAKQNIVVVGAGYAGVSATKFMAKKFKKNDDISITLIDRHSYHTMMTELHEVAAARVEPSAIQYDLQRLFCRKKNVQLVTDTVTNIDKDTKTVQTKNGQYPFDHLIIGMGGEPNDFGTPGVKENGFTLWSFEDALRIREHIEKTVARAALEPDAKLRKAMLTFVVCGSGFTGIEMIGELVDWKERLAKDNKLEPNEINLKVVEALPTILNMLKRNDAAKAERYMKKKNVDIMTNSPIVEVSPNHIKLKDGSTVATHTLIWTAGVKGTSDAADFGLETARGNRLVANEYMQAKGYEDKNIYIVGDLVYYEEFSNTPTPQIVQAAEQTGHTAATHIVSSINGGQSRKFKGNYQGFMVSVGAKWGVANLFDKIHLSGFLAMIMKHIVNLKYFFDIRTGYYMFQYIMHEFFRVKDDRNVARGHTSRNSNVLWSVPLRVFYGLVWFLEAFKKIVGDGKWFTPSTWFGEESWFKGDSVFPWTWDYQSITDAASGASEAADAASGASDAGADAAVEAGNTIFGLSYAYGEEPMAVIENSPDWFMNIMKTIMPNMEVAMFFQKMMVFVEIGIALCLMAGLFTWLFSGATIILVATFCLSGMFYWVNIWFIPVAFALMNGSGRALGLDHWVIPWLQRTLGKWRYGTPKSLYGQK